MSIIIPVYNVEKYLRECLDSVLQQNFHEMEVICIEDCSTDQSKVILDEYKDRIKVIYNRKNEGLSAARNLGMKVAKGEYILFLDSDDCLEENALSRMAECIEQKNVDVLSFNSKTFGKNISNSYSGIRKHLCNGYKNGIEAYIEQNKNQDYKCTVWQYLYNRDFLEEHHVYFIEGIYHEDIAFVFCAYMYADQIYFIDDILHKYRIHQNSISNNDQIMRKRLEGLTYSYQYCEKRFKNMGCSKMANEAMEIQLDQLSDWIMEYYYKLGIEDRKQYIDQLNESIYSLGIRVLKRWAIQMKQSDILQLAGEHNLYLYGMGAYARAWLFVLETCKMIPKGILVTRLEDTQNEFFGYKVYQFDEFCNYLQETITVIVAVSDKYKDEILDVLYKYPRVIIFSSKML